MSRGVNSDSKPKGRARGNARSVGILNSDYSSLQPSPSCWDYCRHIVQVLRSEYIIMLSIFVATTITLWVSLHTAHALSFQQKCESFVLRHGTAILSNATFISPGGYTTTLYNITSTNKIAFCRISAAQPYPTNNRVQFEVWLPDPNVYNDRFLVLGKSFFNQSITIMIKTNTEAIGQATEEWLVSLTKPRSCHASIRTLPAQRVIPVTEQRITTMATALLVSIFRTSTTGNKRWHGFTIPSPCSRPRRRKSSGPCTAVAQSIRTIKAVQQEVPRDFPWRSSIHIYLMG